MNNIQLIEQVLFYIDKHLSDDITYEELSAEFHYSQFHLHRMFLAVTGSTVVEHLKKRRLENACQLLSGSDNSISDICYGCGFNSIQTFNRLFKAAFGLTPTIFRKSKIEVSVGSIQSIISSYKRLIISKGGFFMEPKFVEKESFMIIGCRKHTKDGWGAIGKAWSELKSRPEAIKNRVNHNISYGFEDYSEDFLSEPLQFYYMASVEVDSLDEIPEGMVGKLIPKATYAVFTVTGNNSNGEIGRAFRYIYDIWLPNSEYMFSEDLCGDLELYDERWDGKETSQVDLYIPVSKKNK